MTPPVEPTVAVVTGGASGIGLALATRLVGQVDHVVVGDVDAVSLESAVNDLSGRRAEVHGSLVDLRDEPSIRELADRVSKLGRLQSVFLNAGVTATGPAIWNTPDDTFRFMFDVNVLGTVNCIRAFVPALIAHEERSSVVITASMAGLVASPFAGAYAASKGAVIALAKALRDELSAMAPQVDVLAVCPGMVGTNLLRSSARLDASLMESDVIEAAHGALNEFGLTPDQQASLVFEAMHERRFWVLPPEGDAFRDPLRQELAELDWLTQ